MSAAAELGRPTGWTPEQAAASSPAQARTLFRRGLVAPTSGWAAGHTQVNLVAVPRDWAFDMLLFGQRNPQPVPLLDVTEPGDRTTALAPGADLATDLPRYRVWRDGTLVDEPADVAGLWTDDLVTFLIGCSFSFERALLDAGVPLRNVEQGRNVAMYRTNRPCRPPAGCPGRWSSPCGRCPARWSPPPCRSPPACRRCTGRRSTSARRRPSASPTSTHPTSATRCRRTTGDVPVFWACGVTPQAALMASAPPFAITHAPGHMLITDVPDEVYRLP
jgi:uncharacterized protein YcsI (UPF0317 family)